MAMTVTCPACSQTLNAPRGAAGREAECPCGAVFRIPEWAPQPLPPGPDEASVPEAPPPVPLARRLPQALLYPWRGNGKGVLVGGIAFYVVLRLLGRVPVVGLIAGVFGAGYLAAFMIRLIRSSAGGEDSPPEWPEFTNWHDDIVSPACQMAAPVAVAFLPWFCYTVVYANATPGVEAEAWITRALLLGGCAYAPMAVLAMALFGSPQALNPIAVAVAILRVPVDYALACAGLLVLVSLRFAFGRAIGDAVPILGPVLEVTVGLYALMVEMRLLGLLYDANRLRLNWFGEVDQTT